MEIRNLRAWASCALFRLTLKFLYAVRSAKRNTAPAVFATVSTKNIGCQYSQVSNNQIERLKIKCSLGCKCGVVVVRWPAKRRSIRVCLEFSLVTFFFSRKRK